MLNKKIGFDVANYLRNHNLTEVVAIFLTDLDRKEDKKILDIFKGTNIQIHKGERIHDEIEVVEKLPIFDFIITVYWPYLLKPKIINLAKISSVNFHPALLPTNRGWYPHVFNLLKQTKAGVTLHCIDDKADTGAIWAQEEVRILSTDTSDKLYARLQNKIYQLFCQNWDKIINNKIKPIPQKQKNANYNSIKDINDFDRIHLNKNYSGREIINILRARTFGKKGYAYFIDDDGNKINVNIGLEKI